MLLATKLYTNKKDCSFILLAKLVVYNWFFCGNCSGYDKLLWPRFAKHRKWRYNGAWAISAKKTVLLLAWQTKSVNVQILKYKITWKRKIYFYMFTIQTKLLNKIRLKMYFKSLKISENLSISDAILLKWCEIR